MMTNDNDPQSHPQRELLNRCLGSHNPQIVSRLENSLPRLDRYINTFFVHACSRLMPARWRDHSSSKIHVITARRGSHPEDVRTKPTGQAKPTRKHDAEKILKIQCKMFRLNILLSLLACCTEVHIISPSSMYCSAMQGRMEVQACGKSGGHRHHQKCAQYQEPRGCLTSMLRAAVL